MSYYVQKATELCGSKLQPAQCTRAGTHHLSHWDDTRIVSIPIMVVKVM